MVGCVHRLSARQRRERGLLKPSRLRPRAVCSLRLALGEEPCNGQRLTTFANTLDLSIDDLIFGPYFGVPQAARDPCS